MADKIHVITDTREPKSTAWALDAYDSDRFVVSREMLDAGDYSLKGFESQVVIERKTLDDFVSTVITDRERWREELRRILGKTTHEGWHELSVYAAVVVEANLADVLNRKYRSAAHPNSVIGAALSCQMDFGIPVVWASGRHTAMAWSADFLARAHRLLTVPEKVDAASAIAEGGAK